MKNDEALLREGIGPLMGQTGKAMRCRMDKNLAEAGIDLNTLQMVLLKHVDMSEGVNQQTLTAHMFIDKTSMTRQIDALEKKNLVTRVPDRADRRQKMIYLTNQGKQILKPVIQVALKTEDEATQGIDKQELETFRKVLKQVRVNLDDTGYDDPCK
jgi:DNA-binding MarR family transcriptional regulator